MKKHLAYASLKLALRFCRWAGLRNPKGLLMDAAGDINWPLR